DTSGYVVCTIDKDLDQIPGHHYDYKKHVHYEVPDEEAERWFWVQALSGDATDNIPGCYRMGTKTAERIIDQAYDDWQPARHGSRQAFIWDRILREYREAEIKYGTKCAWVGKDITSEAAAVETARLVFMQVKAGKCWEPPK